MIFRVNNFVEDSCRTHIFSRSKRENQTSKNEQQRYASVKLVFFSESIESYNSKKMNSSTLVDNRVSEKIVQIHECHKQQFRMFSSYQY